MLPNNICSGTTVQQPHTAQKLTILIQNYYKVLQKLLCLQKLYYAYIANLSSRCIVTSAVTSCAMDLYRRVVRSGRWGGGGGWEEGTHVKTDKPAADLSHCCSTGCVRTACSQLVDKLLTTCWQLATRLLS